MSTNYSSKFNLNKEPELKQKLKDNAFVFKQVPYAFWRADSDGVNVTLYNSGKILVQGKNTDLFTTKFLGITPEEKTPTQAVQSTYSSWIGTDESGKGDYFGPLVIASVLVTPENIKKLSELNIQDSKKLKDAVIEKVAIQIKANSICSVITINPSKYNQLYSKFKNLNTLLAWGHARAIENILEKHPCEHALSDKFGKESLIQNALLEKGQKIKLEQRVRAESDLAVAAASILARNEFVQRIKKMSFQYNMEFQKGASSKVKEQASAFARKHGIDSLSDIAKIHFKTTKELTI